MIVACAARTTAGARRTVADTPIDMSMAGRIAYRQRQTGAVCVVALPAPTVAPEPAKVAWIGTPRAELHRIMDLMARMHGISFNIMISKRRTRPVVEARFAVMATLKLHAKHSHGRPYSLPEIARLVGNRDHTTVLNALRKRGIGCIE